MKIFTVTVVFVAALVIASGYWSSINFSINQRDNITLSVVSARDFLP